MVVGIMMGGLLLGVCSAIASVIMGHQPATTLLVYMTMGMIGSLCLGAATLRHQPDYRR